MSCEWFTLDPNCDIPNWLTMLIELSIGGGIASWFFWKQKQQGDKLQKIIDEQKKFRETKYKFSVHMFRSYLPYLWNMVDSREVLKEILRKDPEEVDSKNKLQENLEMLKDDLEALQFQLTLAGDVLEPHFIEKIRFIIESIREYLQIKSDADAKARVPGIKTNIELLLKEFPNPII